jgi:aspartokinase
VYGVTCLPNQQLVSAVLEDPSLSAAAPVMSEAARRGLRLSLIASAPVRSNGPFHLTYCLPQAPAGEPFDLPPSPLSAPPRHPAEPVAIFSMNGPHFGDRYGITSELLAALDQSNVSLRALNCTVASITGAVLGRDLDAALEAIQGCFEVPGDVLA